MNNLLILSYVNISVPALSLPSHCNVTVLSDVSLEITFIPVLALALFVAIAVSYTHLTLPTTPYV